MYDSAFEALAHEHRRRVLLSLLDEESCSAEVALLTETLEAPNRSQERVRTELHHVHLPKLDNLGFVTWDEPTDEVTRGPRFDDIEPLLECIRNEED
jgi:hypothetical protein